MKRYYHFVFYLNFNLAINIDIAKNKTEQLQVVNLKLVFRKLPMTKLLRQVKETCITKYLLYF